MHFSYFKLVKKLSFPWKGEAFFSPPYDEGYLINCYTKHITNCTAIFYHFYHLLGWKEHIHCGVAAHLSAHQKEKNRKKDRGYLCSTARLLPINHAYRNTDLNKTGQHLSRLAVTSPELNLEMAQCDGQCVEGHCVQKVSLKRFIDF